MPRYEWSDDMGFTIVRLGSFDALWVAFQSTTRGCILAGRQQLQKRSLLCFTTLFVCGATPLLTAGLFLVMSGPFGTLGITNGVHRLYDAERSCEAVLAGHHAPSDRPFDQRVRAGFLQSWPLRGN